MTTRISRLGTVLLLAVLNVACARGALQPSEGFVSVPGGRVWYRIVGSGSRTPLLLVHGGPGAGSCYFTDLTKLADERPVILYDQLGSGRLCLKKLRSAYSGIFAQ